MLKIAICDDNNSIRTKLISMVNLIMEQNNIKGEVVFDSDDADAFYKYVLQNHVDVIFLDIELKSMQSGIDLAKKIRETNKSINIIFSTAHMEYVLLAYKFKTFDYLVKPLSYEKLEECLLRLVKYISSDSLDSIKIKSGSTTYMVIKSEIIFIEKAKSKTHLYTANEMIETSMNLEDFENLLPSNFVRAHKSYIVNINKVLKVDYVLNEIDLVNSYKGYIGRKFKKKFQDILGHK
ncbi:MAG: LytR/AlgR family response regulator transcription factor [Deltaproteobacteria bacterium]